MIYLDLWSDTQTSPAVLVLAAVKRTLAELQRWASSMSQKLKRVGAPTWARSASSSTASVPKAGRPSLTEVVDQAKTNVALIVDEVQHAITSDDEKPTGIS